MIEVIPLAKIEPAPDNLRRQLTNIEGLAQSIVSVGLLEPLLVTPGRKDGMYAIVAGHRRRAALEVAGVGEAECIVRGKLDNATRVEAMLVENLQRENLAPLEEAYGFARLRDECGYSQHKIAERTGSSQSHVSKRLDLLSLPAHVQAMLDSGGITIGDALELTKLVGHPSEMKTVIDEWKAYNSSIKSNVARRVGEIELAEKRKAAIEALRKRKIRVVDAPAGGWYGSTKMKRLGKDHNHVDVARAVHAKLDCHAATVDRFGEALYVCTNPIAHASPAAAKKATAEERRQQREEAAKREARKELKLAYGARESAMRRALTGKLPLADLAAFLCAQLIADSRSDPGRVACKLLGVEPIKSSYGGKDYRTPISEFAAKSTENLLRAGAAIGFAIAEADMTPDYNRWEGRPTITNHFNFLQRRLGYQMSNAEAVKLGVKGDQLSIDHDVDDVQAAKA